MACTITEVSAPGKAQAQDARVYHITDDGAMAGAVATTCRPAALRVWTQLACALLPEGFPHSVTPDYLEYQVRGLWARRGGRGGGCAALGEWTSIMIRVY